MKKCTIVGGVNGAGKSSLLGVLKGCTKDLGTIVDCEVAINDCISKELSFTQESSLFEKNIEQTLRRAKDENYYVRLFYVGLDTVEESKRRVANRVSRGGHDIPTTVVERCFANRWSAVTDILRYCDEALFYDNENGFLQVATYRNGELILEGNCRSRWILELKEHLRAGWSCEG